MSPSATKGDVVDFPTTKNDQQAQSGTKMPLLSTKRRADDAYLNKAEPLSKMTFMERLIFNTCLYPKFVPQRQYGMMINIELHLEGGLPSKNEMVSLLMRDGGVIDSFHRMRARATSRGYWERIPEADINWDYHIQGPYEVSDAKASNYKKDNVLKKMEYGDENVQYVGGVRRYIENLTQDNVVGDDFDIYSGQPLWQMHMISGDNDYDMIKESGFEGSDEKKPKSHVLLFRLHHTIADGFRLALLGSKLFSDEKGEPLAVFNEMAQVKGKRKDTYDGGDATQSVQSAKKKPGLFAKLQNMILKTSFIVSNLLISALQVTMDCFFLTFQTANPYCKRTWISDGDAGLQKRAFLYAPPIDLNAVKGVKNALSNCLTLDEKTGDLVPLSSDKEEREKLAEPFRKAAFGKAYTDRVHAVTVNDVLQGCVAGAVSRYLEKDKQLPAVLPQVVGVGQKKKKRAFMFRNAMIWALHQNPKSTPYKKSNALCNQWLSIIMPMAVFSSVKDRLYTSLERVFATKAVVDGYKYSFYPTVGNWIFENLLAISAWMTAHIIRIYFSKMSIVVTNVPTTQESAYIGAGAGSSLYKVRRIAVPMPQVSSMATLVSYNNNVFVTWSFVKEEVSETEAEVIIRHYIDEFTDLCKRTLELREGSAGVSEADVAAMKAHIKKYGGGK